ncbi:MAG: RhuM family protein [Campylobacterales bacterium]
MMNNLVKYNDGEIEVQISIKEDTIWLTQKQIAELFEVTKQNISLHTIEIFKSKELNKNSTVKKYLTVQKEGNREVSRELEHYNLDVIISVGYRVNSIKATKFRQWATSVLKKYITDGYAINTHKITEQRLSNLENDMQVVKSKIKNDELEIKQGIFYNGQIYDAYAFVNDLLKSAKSEVILIDNYIDDTTFTLCSKYPKINFTIYTKPIDKQLRLDYQKYKKQYKNIELKETKDFHDRFLIIDNSEIYHIGASLKDLGNKVFAFSRLNIDINSFELLEKLK